MEGNFHSIDWETWPRREHFEIYREFQLPHFNICADVDVTALRDALNERDISFNTAILYVLARTANDIPEFRLRIRGHAVVEHETVHPSSTVMAAGDIFGFASFDYSEDFATFAENVRQTTAEAEANPSLVESPERDDVLFMTAIPWVSFTSFSHPMPTIPPDSIPRFAWGRYRDEGDRVLMPLCVQGHHAVMDGLHIGRFFERAQQYLDDPEQFLDQK